MAKSKVYFHALKMNRLLKTNFFRKERLQDFLLVEKYK